MTLKNDFESQIKKMFQRNWGNPHLRRSKDSIFLYEQGIREWRISKADE